MGDLIRYNYVGIKNGQDAIDKFIMQMDMELDAIESKLKPLDTGEAWSGSDAQVAYHDLKSQWRAAAGAIAESLVALKVALGEGSEGIRAADVRSAAYFGG
ncbi:uncharacterized protein YukE [Stackebrandtia albiflava]|uniref:Uncharacterized protein YukE n=1 Tax=Stackebrandtia albiflava TaxID=406432 RepID=A0A562UPF8_9ACTN|nr:hypothetical protein [Stackebrandtia albiflava]TWJ07501.1 uncharacterized protein YukE [Stackebrandtia albiflava]